MDYINDQMGQILLQHFLTHLSVNTMNKIFNITKWKKKNFNVIYEKKKQIEFLELCFNIGIVNPKNKKWNV